MPWHLHGYYFTKDKLKQNITIKAFEKTGGYISGPTGKVARLLVMVITNYCGFPNFVVGPDLSEEEVGVQLVWFNRRCLDVNRGLHNISSGLITFRISVF